MIIYQTESFLQSQTQRLTARNKKKSLFRKTPQSFYTRYRKIWKVYILASLEQIQAIFDQ